MPGPNRSSPAALEPLVALLRARTTVVLTGAGVSTESGIPDYRGPEGRMRARSPVQFQDFVRSPESRARYWARSAVGWTRVGDAAPNPAHEALATLEARGHVNGIITQNVDGLHHAAGSRRVVELHGSLSQVRCLRCDDRMPRAQLQDRLLSENPEWVAASDSDRASPAPDGDAEIGSDPTSDFRVPECTRCGGVLKPDVVFFGENVPPAWVDHAWSLMNEAEVLLVLGSSLTVYSGRRFIYRAAKASMPIGIVNLGPTRGDEHASVKVEGRLGEILPRIATELLAG